MITNDTLLQFMCLFYRLNEFTLHVELPLIKHSLRVLLVSEAGQLIQRFKFFLESCLFLIQA